jgi:hypothetical protein
LKEEIVTKIGLYDLVKFHDPGIQEEPLPFMDRRSYACNGWIIDALENRIR